MNPEQNKQTEAVPFDRHKRGHLLAALLDNT